MTADADRRARHERLSDFFAALYELPEDERAARLEEIARDDAEVAGELRVLLERARDVGTTPGDPLGAAVAEALEERLEVVPERIGPFRILGLIGRGGMGVVYEAEQERPRRRVALKVIRPGYATSAVARRFEGEAQVLAQFTHPGIARVYVAGTASTPFGIQPFLAMERIDGAPLDEAARGMAVRERVACVARVAEAVHHAHQRGVIHRDLKPANVLIQPDGAPKVLDFGIARLVDADGDGTMTHAGQVLGTLAYASPEQLAARPEALDVRSDVYSLGVMLYEVLCGQVPIAVQDTPLPEAVRRLTDQTPAPLGRRDPALRGDLETIAAKAIAKRPEERYGSAQALADDLANHLANRPIEARAPSALYVLRKFARRNLPFVSAGAVAILALVGGLILALAAARRAEVARHAAERSSDRANLMAASSSLRLGDPERVRASLRAVPPERRDWPWRVLHARVDDSLRHFTTPDHYVAAFPLGERLRVVKRERAGEGYEVIELHAETGAVLRSTALAGLPLANATGTHAALHRGHDFYAVADLATGEVTWRVPQAPGERILGFAVDPTGRYVVTHGRPYWAQLYEIGRAEPLCRIDTEREGMPLPPRIGGVGSDLKIAAACLAKTVVVYDRDGRRLWESAAGVERPRILAFDRDGARLAVAGSAGSWSIVEALSGRVLVPGETHSSALHQIAFSADDRRVITLDDRGAVQVWDAARGALIETLHGQRGAALAERMGVAPGRVATVAVDGSARLWDVEPDRPRRIRRLHTSWGTGFTLRPDGRLGVSTSYDGAVVFVEAETLEPIARYRFPDGVASWQVAWLDATRVVVLARRLARHQVLTLDLLSGEVLAHRALDGEALGHLARKEKVDLTLDARRALVYVGGTSLDPLTLVPPEAAPPYLGAPTSLSPGGRDLVGGDLGMRRMSLETGRLVHIEDRDRMVWRWDQAFNDAGTRFAAVYNDGSLKVWDTATWTEPVRRTAHGARALSVAWHPSGRYLVTGGDAGPIAVWDAETIEHVVDLPAHAAYVRSLAFGPDGALFTSCGDGSIGRFDERTTRERAALGRAFAAARVRARAWLAAWPEGGRGAWEAARDDPALSAADRHAIQCELMQRASLRRDRPLPDDSDGSR